MKAMNLRSAVWTLFLVALTTCDDSMEVMTGKVDRAQPCKDEVVVFGEPAVTVVTVTSQETAQGSLLKVELTGTSPTAWWINFLSQSGMSYSLEIPCSGVRLVKFRIDMEVNGQRYAADIYKGFGCACMSPARPCGTTDLTIGDNNFPSTNIGSLKVTSIEKQDASRNTFTEVTFNIAFKSIDTKLAAVTLVDLFSGAYVNYDDQDGKLVFNVPCSGQQSIGWWMILYFKDGSYTIVPSVWKEVGCGCTRWATRCADTKQVVLHPTDKTKALADLVIHSTESSQKSTYAVTVTAIAPETISWVHVNGEKFTLSGSGSFTTGELTEPCTGPRFVHYTILIQFVDGPLVRVSSAKQLGCLCARVEACMEQTSVLYDGAMFNRGTMTYSATENTQSTKPTLQIEGSGALTVAYVQVEMIIPSIGYTRKEHWPAALPKVRLELDEVPCAGQEDMIIIAAICYIEGDSYAWVLAAMFVQLGCGCSTKSDCSDVIRQMWVPYPSTSLMSSALAGKLTTSSVESTDSSAITLSFAPRQFTMTSLWVDEVELPVQQENGVYSAIVQVPCSGVTARNYIVHAVVGVEQDGVRWNLRADVIKQIGCKCGDPARSASGADSAASDSQCTANIPAWVWAIVAIAAVAVVVAVAAVIFAYHRSQQRADTLECANVDPWSTSWKPSTTPVATPTV